MEQDTQPELLPLHPKKLTDEEFASYEAEFRQAFNDSENRNIAVSGPYGAGKSSVVRTWEKRLALEKGGTETSGHKGRKAKSQAWIYVSLANFPDTNVKETDITKLVEGEILSQLIHKIDPKDAPKSRFKKSFDRPSHQSILAATGIALFVALCFALPDAASGVLSGNFSVLGILILFLWLALAVIGLSAALRADAFSQTVKRLKFMEAEVDLFDGEEAASSFDKNLDDLVYLLNASGVEVVVFEDLDRFGSVFVLRQLRNLNIVVNDSRDDESGKPLRFLYLIKDSLFADSRDRTKFFDFIIPVIPYVDPNNAFDVLKSGLAGVGIDVDESFLFQLASFVDDPRILHDIVNESYHYSNALFGKKRLMQGDSERIVAMVAYKVIFPKDFECFQVGRGYVYEVLHRKNELVNELRFANDDEIAIASAELRSIEERLKLTEAELELLYAGPYLGNRGLNDNYSTVAEMISAIQTNKNSRDFLRSIIDNFDKEGEYWSRVQEARGDADRKSAILKRYIESAERDKELLSSLTIKELVNRADSADVLFNIDGIDNLPSRCQDYAELDMESVINSPAQPMLRFLISSGWIDESYDRYVSNFYADSLTLRDNDYLSAIRQASPLDLSYKPDSPREIIERMDSSMFARKSIRNPWLMAELFRSGEEQKIESLMNSLKRDEANRFLIKFVNSPQFTSEVFGVFFDHTTNPVVDALDDESIGGGERRKFCRRYLAYGGDMFECEEPDGDVAAYVNNEPLIIERDEDVDAEKLLDALRHIHFRPLRLNVEESNRTILDAVYQEGMYEPNAMTVDAFASQYLGHPGLLASGVLIGSILKADGTPLKAKVESEINLFVSSVVETSDCPIRDDEECIARVLNNENVAIETAESYISNIEGTVLTVLEDIEYAVLRAALMKAGMVLNSAQNIIVYLSDCAGRVDETLESFIAEHGVTSGLTASALEECGMDPEPVVSSLVKSAQLDDGQVDDFVRLFGYTFDVFTISGISKTRMLSLIESGSIAMNAENLDWIRRNHADLSTAFALSSIEEYTPLAVAGKGSPPSTFVEAEALRLFEEQNLDSEWKIELLKGFNGAVHMDSSYPDSLNIAIADSHLDRSDFSKIPNLYTNGNVALKDRLTQLVADNINDNAVKSVALPWPLVIASLEKASLDRTESLNWITCQLKLERSDADRQSVRKAFEATGSLDDYVKLIDGPQSMIPVSDQDEAMLRVLRNLDMCGEASGEVNSEGLRKVHSRGFKRK